MGFGLLFIGYFIAYLGAFLPQISLFTYVLGSGVILFSLRKLIYENKLFISSAIVAIVLELLSIISLGINVLNGGRGTTAVVLVYIVEFLAYAFNILVMLSISKLAKDVELPKLSIMALINVGFVSTGLIFFVLSESISSQSILMWLTPIYVVLKLIYSIFSLVIIFNSYMRICYEGDEKMQKETTGIKLFDKLNSLTNKAYSFKKNDKGGKK
jgi:hypothetical protein